MRMMLLSALCVTAFAGSAQAVMVSNLTDEPRKVVFETSQNSQMEREIPAQSTRRVGVGRGWVREAGSSDRGIFAFEHDQLTIWPKSGLVLQMRRNKYRKNH